MLSLETAQFANSFDRECWEFFFRSIPVDWKSFGLNDSQTWSELWMENENWSCWPKWTFANFGPFFCPVNNFFEVRYTIRYTQFFFLRLLESQHCILSSLNHFLSSDLPRMYSISSTKELNEHFQWNYDRYQLNTTTYTSKFGTNLFL